MKQHSNAKTKFSVLLIMVMLITGCSMVGLPFTGQVSDVETGEPIEGAIVVALFNGTSLHSSSVCLHVETAVSDKEGKFRVPGWFKYNGVRLKSLKIHTYIYKRGYERVMVNNRYPKDDVRMRDFKGTTKERIKYLQSLVQPCTSAEKSEKNLLMFRESLYKEVKDIAKTQDEKQTIEWFLSVVERIKYGYEEAERRQFQRMGVNQ